MSHEAIQTKTYHYTIQDLRRLYWKILFRTRWWLMVIMAVLGLSLFGYGLSRGDQFYLILGVALAIEFPVVMFIMMFVQYRGRSVELARLKRTVSIADGKLLIDVEDGSHSENVLTSLPFVRHIDNWLLIYFTQVSFVAVPRHAFEDAADFDRMVETFRNLRLLKR